MADCKLKLYLVSVGFGCHISLEIMQKKQIVHHSKKKGRSKHNRTTQIFDKIFDSLIRINVGGFFSFQLYFVSLNTDSF